MAGQPNRLSPPEATWARATSDPGGSAPVGADTVLGASPASLVRATSDGVVVAASRVPGLHFGPGGFGADGTGGGNYWGETTERGATPSLLPKRNAYIGMFTHAPRSGNAGSKFFDQQVVSGVEHMRRVSIRHNPHLGALHVPDVLKALKRVGSDEQIERFTEIFNKLAASKRARTSASDSKGAVGNALGAGKAPLGALAPAKPSEWGPPAGRRVLRQPRTRPYQAAKFTLEPLPRPRVGSAAAGARAALSGAASPEAELMASRGVISVGAGGSGSGMPAVAALGTLVRKDTPPKIPLEFVPIGVGTPSDKLGDHYELGATIGEGEFAVVRRAKRLDSRRNMAHASTIVAAGAVVAQARRRGGSGVGLNVTRAHDDASSTGSGGVGGARSIDSPDSSPKLSARSPHKSRLGKRFGPGTPVVVKAIRKRYLISDGEKAAVVREVSIHARMHHTNIVELLDTYEDKDHAYLVMESANGGDLQKYLDVKRRLPEAEAALLFAQMLDAVLYMHSHDVVHCDLKPKNIVLDHDAPGEGDTMGVGCTPLICDFGNARRAKDPRYYKHTGSVKRVPFEAVTGTPGYVAPEILRHQHFSTEVDMWSLGSMLYLMVSGLPAFSPPSACLKRDVLFPSPFFDSISEPAKDLLSGLLQSDPAKRTTAMRALSHPWLNHHAFSLA